MISANGIKGNPEKKFFHCDYWRMDNQAVIFKELAKAGS